MADNTRETPHTPTPWRIGRFEGHVIASDDRLVAGCQGYHSVDSRDVNNANAAFIVEACNAYDRLLAEHRAMETALRKVVDANPPFLVAWPARRAAKAALALVDARRAQMEPTP